MKNFLFVFPVVMLFVTGCATPEALVTSRDAVDEFILTGFSSGMTDGMELHENSGFYYKFERDRDNLYLLLATSDLVLQRKIIYFGLTIWTDRTGNHNKNQGFRFPVDGQARPLYPSVPQVQAETDFNTLLSRAGEIDLIGIYGSSVRTVKRRDSRIRVDASIQDDFLVYKAVVPFGLLKHGFNPVADNGKMSLGIETGSFKAPSQNRRARDFDGRRPGGGLGQPGGMTGRMPGQAPGRMPGQEQPAEQWSDMNLLSRPTRLWIDLSFNTGSY